MKKLFAKKEVVKKEVVEFKEDVYKRQLKALHFHF